MSVTLIDLFELENELPLHVGHLFSVKLGMVALRSCAKGKIKDFYS